MEQLLAGALKISFLELISLVGPLLVIGLILGIMERRANQYLFAAFGFKGILATAWLGTPIHELGHAVMCLIFGHKITDMKLLTINRADGTLGYVSHTYNQRSIYQTVGNFFIGIAPLISGIGVLFLCLHFLLPDSFKIFEAYLKTSVLSKPSELTFVKGFIDTSLVMLRNIFTFSNLLHPNFWIFLLIAISVSSHMALSRADIKGALHGLIMLYLVFFIVTIIGNSIGVNTYSYIAQLARYNAYLLTLSVLALIFSLFSFGLSFIVYYYHGI